MALLFCDERSLERGDLHLDWIAVLEVHARMRTCMSTPATTETLGCEELRKVKIGTKVKC
jgi:hypothetical protein